MIFEQDDNRPETISTAMIRYYGIPSNHHVILYFNWWQIQIFKDGGHITDKYVCFMLKYFLLFCIRLIPCQRRQKTKCCFNRKLIIIIETIFISAITGLQPDQETLLREAFKIFMHENALNPMEYPALR